MKKIFYITFSFILFIVLGITNVRADECSYKELKELKELAKKVEVSYLFSGVSEYEDGTGFTVTVHNLLEEYYLESHYGTYRYSNNSSVGIGYFSSGTKVKIDVYASNKTKCNGEKLRSVEVQLPYFNKYSTRSECVGKEQLNVCKKWYNTIKLNEEEFKKIVNDSTEKEKINFWDKVVLFVEQNFLIVISCFIFVLTFIFITVIIIKNKNKKKKKLNI